MADAMAQSGANVCIWGTNVEKNAAALEQLSAHGTEVEAMICDVSDEAQVEARFADTVSRFGNLHGVFANAGVSGGREQVPFVEMTTERWRHIVGVNLDGAFYTFRAAARHMIEHGEGGRIAGTASLAALSGAARNEHYAATKGVSVGLQNHPSTGDDMLRIRSETDRENFNFIMDTGQWVGSPGGYEKERTEVDFYGFMEQTAPYAMYIRTKFYKIESGTEEWIDYGRIVPIIKGVDYNGCISIVYEGQEEDRVEQVRKAAVYLREHLG